MWQPRPVSRRCCRAAAGARGHHVRHDDVAIGHGTRNDRVAIGPAGQVCATRQRAARAVDPPFLRHRPGLAVDTARDHDDAGIRARRASIVQPSFAIVPGEKFSTTTSAQSISGLEHLAAFRAVFMSSDRLRLELLRCANQGLSSKLPARDADTCTSIRDRQGRVRLSTLMTSAPRSPSTLVVIDPTSAHEKSRTRTPARGPVLAGCARARAPSRSQLLAQDCRAAHLQRLF